MIEAENLSTKKAFRMFLVDDHPLMRQALRLLLEASGDFFVVGEAGSAEEALELLETASADVVVMDILLPGMDGIEATRELKLRHSQMKVVMVSGFGQEYLIASIEAGADGYLLKTVDLKEIVRSLYQVARG